MMCLSMKVNPNIKNFLMIVFCICILSSFILFVYYICSSCCKQEHLYPINDTNGGGYINKDGVIVLEQKYGFAGRFVGDYAIVQDENLKYGIIDKKGTVVIDFEYDELDNLSENFVIYKENEKYRYINILKNKKSNVLYDAIKPFKEGLAAVYVDGKWGFIDKYGKCVIMPKYYDVSNFSEGLAAVYYSPHETAGYINKNDEFVISFNENNLIAKDFHEGLAAVVKGKDSACSYINKQGKIVIDKDKIYPMVSFCSNFSQGFAVVYIYNNQNEITTGYMDKEGNLKYSMVFSIPEKMLPEEFSAFDTFSSDMAQVTIDYKTGYIDNKFQMVIPLLYEFARDFNGDLAYVKFEDKEGYINKKGQWIWSKPREGM
ncbi:MAG: WG repeat-containing protein [Elusimicrobia bacterium]|nr:WG repeat-containing protein [Elusimicrobiota bacterium]